LEEFMGIFGALTTAVTGLRAQSFALENISGNIANSQTTGFKRVDTNFEDLIPDNAPSKQLAGSVIASSRATNAVQGDLQTASISTFMAINGEGFFIVQKPTGSSDNRPVFDGTDLYTRRGDFQINQDGYLTNGAGYYLMGIPVDAKTGNLAGSVPQVLQFKNDFSPAQQTTELDYRANLPSTPITTNFDPSIPGSDLLNPVNFISNPIAGAPSTAKITGKNAVLNADAHATGLGTTGSLVSGTTLSSLGISNGQTFTVNDGTNTTTYTVVNAATETVGNLVTAIDGGAAAVSASLVGGKIQIVSDNYLDTLTIGGTAATAAGFDSSNSGFTPMNLLQQGVTQSQTLTIATTSFGTQTITFGTGAGEVSTLAGLLAKLQTTPGIANAAVDANGNVSFTAANANDDIHVGSALSTEVNASKFGMTVTDGRPADGTVIANDQTAFLNASLGGGAITAYDISGTPVNVQMRWAKVDSVDLGSSHNNVWNLFYQVNSNAIGTNIAWRNVGVKYTFGPNGQLTPPVSNVTLSDVTVDGTSLGDIQLVHDAGGVTQFADSNGSVQVNLLKQNGFPAGSLQTVSVSDKGRVVGTYSNGRTIDLAEVTLANFNGADGLRRMDGGAFAATEDSGAAVLGAPGKIVGSSLEGSNVDIADEFTKLIVTQQAYSANTRVVTTSNQMVQDVLNMLR
jgi:flagellar hook protein FlgE